MILDYSEYLEDSQEFSSLKTSLPKSPEFFSNRGVCPSCRNPAPTVASESHEQRVSTIDEHGIERTAFQCPCGWWQTQYYDWRNDSGFEWNYYGVRHAILRHFDPADSALPVAVLRRALVANPDLIDEIAKRKTEELVQSVFADFFNCEARHVGRSHDGGIDLILVRADKVMLVQIKNRDKGSKRWKSEPVSTVREFLAAFMLAGGQYGLLITTAHHFSSPAKAAAKKALTLKDVRRYDLIDRGELLRTLSLTADRIHEHWRDNFIFTVK